jgi:hypothetical protein
VSVRYQFTLGLKNKTFRKIEHLKMPSMAKKIKPRISHPKRIKEIAGCMSDTDANEMRRIIEDSCEKVDRDAW